MSRINILFSSTRQWNPGDEIILHGIRNLLSELEISYNPILYNRHPDIRTKLDHVNPLRYIQKSFFGSSYLESIFRIGFKDNSFKNCTDGEFLDLVIFAGTPAWHSNNTRVLYRVIQNTELPTMFIGIGSDLPRGKNKLPHRVRRTLKKTDLLITRNQSIADKLSEFGAKHMICPSFFSIDDERVVRDITRIGLVFMTHQAPAGNDVPSAFSRGLNDLYQTLIKVKSHLDMEIICHYIDEVPRASNQFQEIPVRYSHEYDDYLSFYKDYDLIISPRIHGVLPAASFGTPGIYLPHDPRSRTVSGVAGIRKSELDNEPFFETFNVIKKNIRDISEKILHQKKRQKQKYLRAISMSLCNNTSIPFS